MSDSYLAYQNPTVADKKLDSASLLVGANTVERERVQIAGAADVDIAPVSATNGLAVDVKQLATGTNAIGRVGHDITGISDGRTTVTNAGTRVVLASSTACKKVIITALFENTGVVVVGGTTVIAASGTRRGHPLNAGDAITIEIDNLNDINIDSTVSSEGVSYVYFT